MRGRLTVAALTLVALSSAPSLAHADGYISPFLGVNFGGAAGKPLGEAIVDSSKSTFGFQVGGMGGGIFGFEFDLAYTKNFYGDGRSFVDNNLLTMMPSLIIGVPIGGTTGGGIRPYFTAGMGLVRRRIDFVNVLDLSQNDLAYSLGGGLMGFVSDNIGFRGDFKYFRNFQVDEFSLGNIDLTRGTFNFSRGSVGVVFRF